MIKRAMIIVIASMILLILLIFLIKVSLSKITSWCPLSHMLDFDMYCVVHDTWNDKVLVEHFNRDTNILQLSIHSKKETIWIKHPYGKAQSYLNRVPDNKIKFDRKDAKRIIVNNRDTLKIEIITIE